MAEETSATEEPTPTQVIAPEPAANEAAAEDAVEEREPLRQAAPPRRRQLAPPKV